MPIKFTQPFTRMPVRFNPEALVAEVKALPKDAWVPHPDALRAIYYMFERLVFENAIAGVAEPEAHKMAS